MTFSTLGLRPESLRAIADQGYIDPTPVQAQAIPAILAGRDVLAGAQTGTGKTAAFVLPMIETLHATRERGPSRVRGLVVVPTRELALQVEQSIRTYGAHRPVRSTTIFGGMPMDRQVRALRSGVEVVVATPGRLLDHVRQRTIDLRNVEILVLDEADRMLDMGFIHDVKRILEELPVERQSLLFSATFDVRIRRLAEDLLRQPVSIDVAPRNTTAAPIRQVIHPVDRDRKRDLLSHMLRVGDMDQALVFTRTKHGANRLAEQLGRDGIAAIAIHGNKSQSQRVRALTAFKQGRSQVLVATDIAARGLDIESLPFVVNFEMPHVPEDYVHRIGRTGRAGRAGTAISLVAAEEDELVRAIERLLRTSIERKVIGGYEPSVITRPMAPRPTANRPSGARPTTPRGAATRPPRDGEHRGGPARHRRGNDGVPQPGWSSAEGGGRRGDGKRRGPGDRSGHASGPVSTAGVRSGRPAPTGGSSGPRPQASHQARPQAPSHGRSMPGERLSGHHASGDRRPAPDRARRAR